MDLTNQKVSGVNEISLQDSLNAAVLEIKIKRIATTVAPEGNDVIIYVDKDSSLNPTTDRKQYIYNLTKPLNFIQDVGDEIVQKIEIKNNEVKLNAYVNRLIGTNDTESYILTEPEIEELDSIDITLFEGVNYIYTNYQNAEITITYPKNDDFNKIFLNNSIYNRHKEDNCNNFSLEEIYFKDAFTKSGDELNLKIDNMNVKCITSKDNKFSLDSDGNLTVNSITTSNNNAICDLIYPIGSIYLSVNSIEPSNLFGGTWEQIKDKFLLASGDTYLAGSTGGEATHILTEKEMPKHRHTLTFHNHDGSGNSGKGVPFTGNGSSIIGGDATGCGYAGGSSAHNNMPPYLSVYIWKRIS